jgi:hypothetical protein
MNDSTSKPSARPILGVKKATKADKGVPTAVPVKKTVILKPSHPATDPDVIAKKAEKPKTTEGRAGASRPSTKMTWQELEAIVRSGAEAKFGARARAETIAGVKCDCVIDLQNGSVVLVEISKENTLEKLRTDLAKFNALRPFFLGEQICPKCYFITLEDPTESLIESGKANYVDVQSISQFLNYLFGTLRYGTVRRTKPFGSAVDIYSGEPDVSKYVRVSYFDEAGTAFNTERIVEELLSNRTVVLIGDYGAGKSRCVKEVFELLYSQQKENYRHTISINLRDNWGLKRSSEIITRHFTDIGLEDLVSCAQGRLLSVGHLLA